MRERIPAAPRGLKTSGKRLWKWLQGAQELRPDEELLLTQACRCADTLDRLAEEAAENPVTVINVKGDRVPHPALTESRQQAQNLARMLAALRIPDDETGERAQRRGSPRGAYQRRNAAQIEGRSGTTLRVAR